MPRVPEERRSAEMKYADAVVLQRLQDLNLRAPDRRVGGVSPCSENGRSRIGLDLTDDSRAVRVGQRLVEVTKLPG